MWLFGYSSIERQEKRSYFLPLFTSITQFWDTMRSKGDVHYNSEILKPCQVFYFLVGQSSLTLNILLPAANYIYAKINSIFVFHCTFLS